MPPPAAPPSSPPTAPAASPAAQDNLSRLKPALWLALGRLVDASVAHGPTNASARFIGALTEMVWAQIETAAGDLERFARHAGRGGVVRAEDVLLLARRNEDLEGVLRRCLEEVRREAGG